MPYSVCKKLNAEPQICKMNIIQLDRSHVKVLGELKGVLIRLSSNSKVHQIIDIIVVDIPDAYGVILSRNWLAKLNGYFAMDQSHLWLPYKGQPNKIKVEHELYMKHMVTGLNVSNEPIMFLNSILRNFHFDMFFGELEVEVSPLANSDKKSELLHSTHIVEHNCTIVDSSTCTKVDSSDCTAVVSSSTNFCVELTDPNIWTLQFDGSRNKEGAGVGYLLIDPHNNKMMLACHLEFDCMNNVVEYEALIQGLIKSLDLQIKCIEVFGDSQKVIRQVRDSIHCTSHHLKNYQWEVWDLMHRFKCFNIISIPHLMNFEAYMLDNAA